MILIIPDKFKGSYTACEVADGVENTVKQFVGDEEIMKIPLADGGDGFLSVISAVFPSAERVEVATFDPLKRPITAPILIYGDMAFIEMASCCGLSLLSPQERNPEATTTYGLGILLLDAASRGVSKIYVGIGGSATNDGGAGMLSAIGDSLYLFDNIEVTVACDVTNPLLGRNGATYVYAPQKGADADMLKRLEKRMAVHARDCSQKLCEMGRQEQAEVFATVPGGGAAGGIGAALYGFLNADLIPGWQIVGDLVGLSEKIAAARIVITGEGSIDGQSFSGKLISGISKLCEIHRRKLFAVCGVLKCSLRGKWIHDVVEIDNFGKNESVSEALSKPAVIEKIREWCAPEEASWDKALVERDNLFGDETQVQFYVGCDEAGRGPLAGPVYAAAVVLPKHFYHPLLKDSKKLTADQRDMMREIIEKEAIAWSVASCSAEEIDQMNILRASITAMHRALDGLFASHSERQRRISPSGTPAVRSFGLRPQDDESCHSERQRRISPNSSPDVRSFGLRPQDDESSHSERQRRISPNGTPAVGSFGLRPQDDESSHSERQRRISPNDERYALLIDGNRFLKYKDLPHKCIVKGDAKVPAISAASILAKTHRDEYIKAIAKEYPQYGWEHNMGYCTAEHITAIHSYGQTPYHRKSFTVPPQDKA